MTSEGNTQLGMAAPERPIWERLELPHAKRWRGRGWSTFHREVVAERGGRCERCRSTQSHGKHKELHLHHLISQRDFRNFRFEKWNVVVLCQSCHTQVHLYLKECEMGRRGVHRAAAP